MKNAWAKWVKIVKIVVNIQASIILFVLYYLIILPMALILRVFSNKSLKGHGHELKDNSLWISRMKIKHSLIEARAQ